MKQKIAILQVLFFLCIVSCGDWYTGRATVTVYNHSDSDVTDIVIVFGGGFPSLATLKKGEEHTFNLSWEVTPARNSTIKYCINGKQFGVEHEEGAVLSEPGNYYYSPQYLKDGAKAYIFIKNDSYELIIEGGGIHKDPGLSQH